MSGTITNAAPMTYFQGDQDLSTRPPVITPEVRPTHLPHIWTYAQKGPTGRKLVVGDAATQMYGADTFDERKAYATHATVLFNQVNAQGNTVALERLIPEDAPKPASIRISADVLLTTITDYQRNADGSIKTDPSTGLPVPVAGAPGTISGAIVKFVATAVPLSMSDQSDTFGLATQGPGDQTTTGETPVQSVRYPLFDLDVPSQGIYGNNNGLQIYAPTIADQAPIDARPLTDELVYPFRLRFMQRPDATTTPAIVPTSAGAQFVNFCLKPGVIDKNTDAQLYIGDVAIQSYQDLNDPDGNPDVYGPFGRLHVYDSQITALLSALYPLEVPHIDAFSDFTGAANEQYRYNLFSGVSSSNVPYHSYQLNTADSNAVRLTSNTTLYAQGGGDGTMSEALFATLVTNAVAAYADPNDPIQDIAAEPQSIVYDSGFPMATKLALAQVIAVRPDMSVGLCTHDVLGPPLSADQESSAAIALKTRLQMYPESSVFGTPTTRGFIVPGSGTMIGSQYSKPLPLIIEVATKFATYMGAGNQVWKSNAKPDGAPGSVGQLFSSVNVKFRPAGTIVSDWTNGLVGVQSFDLRSYFYPAYKTVYENDTSILTSVLNMMVVCECEKIGEAARRQYSGVSYLTNSQLIKGVNNFVTNTVKNMFDGRVTIIPNCTINGFDEQRGYSWTLVIQIYGPSMKTVQTLTIQSYRIEDLPTQQAA